MTVLWALGYLLGQLLPSAGLMALAARALAGRRVSLGHALGMATLSGLRLLRLGVGQLAVLAMVFAPFLGLAGLTYGLLLTGHDINYYLAEKPSEFLVAGAIVGVLGAGLLALATFGIVSFDREPSSARRPPWRRGASDGAG